ncbi:MAG TPA: protein phosphatase 2C domain-containing protein [Vicinamibacterales bacterium]
MLRACGFSDKGSVRLANEDRFAVHEDLGLCIVADGMGGHNAGEIAARMVVDGVGDYLRDARSRPTDDTQRCDGHDAWPFGFDEDASHEGNLIRTSILLASLHIFETAVSTNGYGGMGTTVVAALAVNDTLTVGHVGDSRLYVLSDRRLRRLTTDDSWMATVAANDPTIDLRQYQHHPMRHALTNVVGGRTPTQVHVHEETLVSGARLLLTTDGVHGALDDRCLEDLMGRGGGVESTVRSIVAAALARGSRDNCTVVVAEYC